jgi:hypothetical protein
MTRYRQLRIDNDRLDIDRATNNARPPRWPSKIAELAGGYLWNASTQELIPILGEDHPDYLQNRERIADSIKRWDRGTSR